MRFGEQAQPAQESTNMLKRFPLFAVLAGMVLLATSSRMQAQDFSYPNFSSASGLALNGSAVAPTTNGSGAQVLRITPNSAGQVGSAWYCGSDCSFGTGKQFLSNGFSTTFRFQLSGSSVPGDGIAFVIQGDSCFSEGNCGILALDPASGSTIGYAGLPSLAVEFVPYCYGPGSNNDICDNISTANNGTSSANEVAIQSCGTHANTANIDGSADDTGVPCNDGNLDLASLFPVPEGAMASTTMGSTTVKLTGTSYTPAQMQSMVGLSFVIYNGENFGTNFGLIAAVNPTKQTLTLANPASVSFAPTSNYAIEPVLADGNVHTVHITYTPPTSCGEGCINPNLTVTLDNNIVLTTGIDIVGSVLGGEDGALVGFTGSTGDEDDDDNQDIVSWTYDTAQTSTATGGAQSFVGTFPGYSLEFDLAAGTLVPGSTVTIYAEVCDQNCWTARTCPGPYCGTLILPISTLSDQPAGYIGSAVCTEPPPPTGTGGPCTNNAMPSYNISTMSQSPLTNYCNMAPGLMRGDPVFAPTYTAGLIDTETGCTTMPDPGYGGTGTSQCTSKAVTDCLSDWVNVSEVPASPSASATITLPVNGATYAEGEMLDYAYSCSPLVSPTGPVTSCDGILTNGSMVENAPSGSAIDTSTTGTKTLTVSANVSSGSPGKVFASFNVTSSYTFIGFSSPVSNLPTLNVAQAGQAIPVKFQVLDANGNPVLGLTMPPVSIIFAPAPCSTFNTTGDTPISTMASGNSGFQESGDNYQYNWKTPKSLAGTCGQLQVNLGDGVIHAADFQFK
jgi:Bacterial lectin